MGQRVSESALVLENPEAVRLRLERSLAALDQMIEFQLFDGHKNSLGLEVELDLIEPLGGPRLVNDPVLSRIGRSDLQQELGQFNLEFNVAPRRIQSHVLSGLETDLAATIDDCSREAERLGARVLSIGTLPTIKPEHVTFDRLSSNPRYALLSKRMRHERFRDFEVNIQGIEDLQFETDTVAAEAAATSLQLHLRVHPEDFARFYNAAQIASVFQIAAGANSPFLFGRRLWAESRIPLCEQVLDIRSPASGAPPRVWFGDHWAASATELFAENVRGFIPLLPCLDEHDPGDALSMGRVPRLGELRMHSGTIWRWNRPVYDVQAGKPQLRIENRVLASGPTPADMVANAALFYGLIRTLADEEPPASHRIAFETIRNAFYAVAKDGLETTTEWEGGREVRVVDLMMGSLARAADGLDAWGIDTHDREHYLAIIADRVVSGHTGAWWQTTLTRRLQDRGLSRDAALTEMTRTYAELASWGRPVHTWPVSVERAS